MVRPRDPNPRPPAPKADALPTELSRRLNDGDDDDDDDDERFFHGWLHFSAPVVA